MTGSLLGSEAPLLTGELNVLRAWRADDAPALAAAWRDPLIQRYSDVPSPADESVARRWISQRERAWAGGVSADLAVTDAASGTIVGEVGLSRFDFTRRAAVVGWWTAQGWRRQGRAKEAVRLVVDWVFVQGHLDAVLAEIFRGNAGSISVAVHAGLRQVDALHPDPSKSGLLVFARTRS